MARLKLRQGFGRLIRAATDRGVFVLLDRRAPTRLLSALPAGVAVQRLGLAEVAAQTSRFLTVPQQSLICGPPSITVPPEGER